MRSSEATSRWWDCNPTAFASLLWCMEQQSLDNEAVCAVFLSAANYFFKKVDQADAKRILAKGMMRLTVHGNMSKILKKYTCECFQHVGDIVDTMVASMEREEVSRLQKSFSEHGAEGAKWIPINCTPK